MSLSFKGQYFIILLRSGHHQVTLRAKHKLITLTIKENIRCWIQHQTHQCYLSKLVMFFVSAFPIFFSCPPASLVLNSCAEIWIFSKYSVYNGCFVPLAVYWENALIIHLLFISDLQRLLVFEIVTFMSLCCSFSTSVMFYWRQVACLFL